MGIKTVCHPPYSSDLAPYDFLLFPKLRGSHYERIQEMKEALTKVIDTLTQDDFDGAIPEVVGTVQQVHCSRGRWVRRGLEFHVCTINKSTHTKKVWKLIVCTLYVYACRVRVCTSIGWGIGNIYVCKWMCISSSSSSIRSANSTDFPDFLTIVHIGYNLR